jgi:sporulation protein YlmC with PRC-barrel domain
MIRESNLAGLVGAKVVDRDGDKIGTVGRIYVDPSTGRANWAAIRTGLFGTSETFLPLQEADEEGEIIRVPYEKSFVKDAPRIDDDTELTHEEEDELYAYYDSLLPRVGGPDAGARDVVDERPVGEQPVGDRPLAAESREPGSEQPAAVAPAAAEPTRPRLRKHVLTDGDTATSRGSVRAEPGTDTPANA